MARDAIGHRICFQAVLSSPELKSGWAAILVFTVWGKGETQVGKLAGDTQSACHQLSDHMQARTCVEVGLRDVQTVMCVMARVVKHLQIKRSEMSISISSAAQISTIRPKQPHLAGLWPPDKLKVMRSGCTRRLGAVRGGQGRSRVRSIPRMGPGPGI